MFLIAGLGNPGAQYADTRHNIGFMAIDALARRASFTSKFHSEVVTHTIDGEKCLLLKPQTYMNNSGRAIQSAMTFYKIPLHNVIVLHDEIDLPLGKIRIKQGGGANGHNGLKDIDQLVGDNYWRIRLGVGRPEGQAPVHDYVLGRFTSEQMADVERLLKELTDKFALFWQSAPEVLASKVAQALLPPKPKKPEKKEPSDGI
jgi:PTH1 family peptidyl-tRNA hydrolase